MDPVSITGAVLSVTATALKCSKVLDSFRQQYNIASVTISAICSETTIVSASLSQLQVILLQGSGAIKPELIPVLDTAITGCNVTFSCLEREVGKITAACPPGSSATMVAEPSMKMKLKLLFNEDTMKELLQHIRGQQSALTFLLQLLQMQSLTELVTMLRKDQGVFRKVADDVSTLREAYPEVHVAESIFENDMESVINDMSSMMDDREFGFDDLVINSKAYRRAFAAAQRRARRKSDETLRNEPPGEKQSSQNLDMSAKSEMPNAGTRSMGLASVQSARPPYPQWTDGTVPSANKSNPARHGPKRQDSESFLVRDGIPTGSPVQKADPVPPTPLVNRSNATSKARKDMKSPVQHPVQRPVQNRGSLNAIGYSFPINPNVSFTAYLEEQRSLSEPQSSETLSQPLPPPPPPPPKSPSKGILPMFIHRSRLWEEYKLRFPQHAPGTEGLCSIINVAGVFGGQLYFLDDKEGYRTPNVWKAKLVDKTWECTRVEAQRPRSSFSDWSFWSLNYGDKWRRCQIRNNWLLVATMVEKGMREYHDGALPKSCDLAVHVLDLDGEEWLPPTIIPKHDYAHIDLYERSHFFKESNLSVLTKSGLLTTTGSALGDRDMKPNYDGWCFDLSWTLEDTSGLPENDFNRLYGNPRGFYEDNPFSCVWNSTLYVVGQREIVNKIGNNYFNFEYSNLYELQGRNWRVSKCHGEIPEHDCGRMTHLDGILYLFHFKFKPYETALYACSLATKRWVKLPVEYELPYGVTAFFAATWDHRLVVVETLQGRENMRAWMLDVSQVKSRYNL